MQTVSPATVPVSSNLLGAEAASVLQASRPTGLVTIGVPVQPAANAGAGDQPVDNFFQFVGQGGGSPQGDSTRPVQVLEQRQPGDLGPMVVAAGLDATDALWWDTPGAGQ